MNTKSLDEFWNTIEPDEPEEHHPPDNPTPRAKAPREVSRHTGLPFRYRSAWPRPEDHEWQSRLSTIMEKIQAGGIVALIGPRGRGKTRLAAEAMRDYGGRGCYLTAMELFLRIRATYGNLATETEHDIAKEVSTTAMLVIDEIQERGNTAWEDRLLTHVIDRRYAAMMPTIIIANLTPDELAEGLGKSIISRMQETGGVIEVTGKSHRVPKKPRKTKSDNESDMPTTTTHEQTVALSPKS